MFSRVFNLFINLLIYSSIYLFINLFIYIFIFLFICLFIFPVYSILAQSLYAHAPWEGVLSHYRWLLDTMFFMGSELRASGRAASVLYLWAICVATESYNIIYSIFFQIFSSFLWENDIQSFSNRNCRNM